MCERQTDECLSLTHTHTGVRQNGRGTRSPALRPSAWPPIMTVTGSPGLQPHPQPHLPPPTPQDTLDTPLGPRGGDGPRHEDEGCSQAALCLFLGPFQAPLLQVEKQPRSRPEQPLTTLSSGTDRLNVHSWLFTKASVKQEGERE